jgi:hypothetical protein
MLPVIVKVRRWISREFMGMLLLDPHTSTLMPDMQLSAARLVRSSLSIVSLGAGCRWVGRTCHMERPRQCGAESSSWTIGSNGSALWVRAGTTNEPVRRRKHGSLEPSSNACEKACEEKLVNVTARR